MSDETNPDEVMTRSVILAAGAGAEVSFARTRLVVESGPDEGLEVELGARPWVLGRSAKADITLEDPTTSRSHCRIEPADDGWRLVDLESKSGTWLGDTLVEAVVLETGRTVRIGESRWSLRQERATLRSEAREDFHGLRTQDAGMRRLFGVLARVAPLELPVLLLGESGTGKEGLARAVHKESRRKDGPYVVVDCTLLTGDHLRSELFGHSQGAFTGAEADRDGAFVQADGGTLVLDEVGELPMEIQPMLLRVLEQGEVRPLGSDATHHVRVRVVAATNRDLAAMVQAGEFRGDLYHRLSAIELEVPPLRERSGDAIFLAEHLLGSDGPPLGPAARQLMQSHTWPGNVRELRNAIQRAAALAQDEVTPDDLGLRDPVEVTPPEAGAAVPVGGTVRERTHAAVLEALARHKGNRKAAAEELGISRTTLYRKLREMQSDEP